jgi:hypothetical protein
VGLAAGYALHGSRSGVELLALHPPPTTYQPALLLLINIVWYTTLDCVAQLVRRTASVAIFELLQLSTTYYCSSSAILWSSLWRGWECVFAGVGSHGNRIQAS